MGQKATQKIPVRKNSTKGVYDGFLPVLIILLVGHNMQTVKKHAPLISKSSFPDKKMEGKTKGNWLNQVHLEKVYQNKGKD